MKGAWALTLFGVLSATGAADEANPLGKVVELLDSLAAKITQDGELEAKAYKEYSDWCDDFSTNKKFEIKTATTEKAELEAAIAKLTSDSEACDSKVEELAASIATADSELKDATVIREKEAKDFTANDAELVDVIDTLGRAISILEREMAKNPAALAQVDASNINGLVKSLSAIVDAAGFAGADKKKLVALVQSQDSIEDEGLGAPAAAVYKSHSTSIVDVIEDLKEKAEEQLSALRKAETNTKHNYEMLKQSLEDSIAADTKDMDEEKVAKSAAGEKNAAAEGDLAVTVKNLADAQAALENANQQCMQTAADHEATVSARAEELKVIAEAKGILTSTTAGADSQTYSLLQTRTMSKLHSRADLANVEVVAIVKRLAKQHHSMALDQLASRIATVFKYGAAGGEDPFVKVKGLISELISKLEAEAESDATEKAFCDEQMAKTDAKKSELEDDVSKLSTKIEVAAARTEKLKDEVKGLQAELATLAKEQAEMDKIRSESHADFVQAKADLELGLEGVRKALVVLRNYYGGAAAAFLQGGMQQPAMPDVHVKATGAGSSIIGILEVVESDFAKNLATAMTEEDDAEDEYQKTTQENKVSKTQKEQDVKYKTGEFTGLDKSIAELTADRETTSTELDAVLEYYAKIKDRCIAKPETFEVRKERREAEIKGLKEALAILEDETVFVQRGKKGGQRGGFLGVAQK